MTRNTATRAPRRALLLVLVAALCAGALCTAALCIGPLGAAYAGDREVARAAAKKGDWKAAAEGFALVLDETPADREAALGLTEASIKAGASEYYAVAEDALLALRERNARDHDVLIALGRMCLATAATKSDTLALKSYSDEALKSFEAAARLKPDSQAAAVGQARVHYESAFFGKAVGVVDAYLARKPAETAEANFWKGQSLYFLAGDTYKKAGASGPLPDAAKALYRRAQEAYAASVAADPSSYATQIQLGYASAWIEDDAAALTAYERAALLEPESVYPLKGIEMLHRNDPEGLPKTLAKFLKAHPKHPQGLWYMGYNRYASKDWPAAIEYLGRAAKVLRSPGQSWFYLAKAHEGNGDAKKAEGAYWKALEAAPDDARAAWALEQYIQKSDPMARARQSVKGAREIIAEYGKILAKAPDSYNVRNNLGFTLREAYVAHQGSRKWIPILRESLKYYVQASDIIGEFTVEKEQTLPYETRHAMAQVISDTGLMFQYYEPTRDYERAVEYYERSLEFSEHGYWDAYNNLRQILVEQKRWDELYDTSAACAEGIKTAKGGADMNRRASARATMEKLVKDGLVKD